MAQAQLSHRIACTPPGLETFPERLRKRQELEGWPPATEELRARSRQRQTRRGGRDQAGLLLRGQHFRGMQPALALSSLHSDPASGEARALSHHLKSEEGTSQAASVRGSVSSDALRAGHLLGSPVSLLLPLGPGRTTESSVPTVAPTPVLPAHHLPRERLALQKQTCQECPHLRSPGQRAAWGGRKPLHHRISGETRDPGCLQVALQVFCLTGRKTVRLHALDL